MNSRCEIKLKHLVMQIKVKWKLRGPFIPAFHPDHVLVEVGESLLDERLEHSVLVGGRRVDEAGDEGEENRVDLARLLAAHHERLGKSSCKF